jgi:hypothetical protein
VSESVPELPEPSPELILMLALVQAHVRTLSKKDRDRFLADVSHSLGAQEAAHNVLRFRPRSADATTLTAMRRASAWWRQIIPVALRLSE